MSRRVRGRLTLQTARRAYMTRRTNNTLIPISPVPTEYIIGGLEIICPNYSYLHFLEETVSRSCCHQGKVSLLALSSFPYEIQELMTSNSVEGKYFQTKIRSYIIVLWLLPTWVRRDTYWSYSPLSNTPREVTNGRVQRIPPPCQVKASLQEYDVPIDDTTPKPHFTPQRKDAKFLGRFEPKKILSRSTIDLC
ncbi:hypothetical protein LAZ67_11001362 [Cordylochernes scorpioides]|uniref:Uncharacterized protein n=1 Tax=Cordylochernes scorpioides TaxID=51811 RepID=A0ABY6L0Q1_9ARAC|nr:hypothetical protein LAZ67_11001362 [Cordylochernes scorpioides]